MKERETNSKHDALINNPLLAMTAIMPAFFLRMTFEMINLPPRTQYCTEGCCSCTNDEVVFSGQGGIAGYNLI